MHIQHFSLGPVGTNCYVINEQQQGIIIDPGAEAEKIVKWLKQINITPLAILLTHAHFDHIGAVEELRQVFNMPVYVHAEEREWLLNPNYNGSLPLRGMEIVASEPDYLVKPGKLSIGPFELDVIHTPGHSPGSVSYYVKDEKFIISGDALFQRGIGRTDLYGGNFDELKHSIQQKLYRLPDNITVYSGHGPSTTIGEEKRQNPFVREI